MFAVAADTPRGESDGAELVTVTSVWASETDAEKGEAKSDVSKGQSDVSRRQSLPDRVAEILAQAAIPQVNYKLL